MAQKDRLSDIIKLVRAEHKVSVSDLAKRYKVTTETIRRDLELLEKEYIEEQLLTFQEQELVNEISNEKLNLKENKMLRLVYLYFS